MKVNLELETITPIFMHGADQGKVEIRTASIKGLMRWWFRAFSMGVLWGSNKERQIIKAILEKESNIFGSTERKSKVRIRVENVQLKSKRLNFRIGRGKYLGYGLNLSNSALGSFQLNLILSSELTDCEAECILHTIWGITYLGGIGSRNRRGFGNLKVNKVNNSRLQKMFIFDGNLDTFLSDNLKIAISVYENLYGVSMKRNLTTLPPIACVHPDFLQIKISNRGFRRLESTKDEEGVLDFCGQIFRRFREDVNTRHYRTVRGGKISYSISQNYQEIKKFLASGFKPRSLDYSIFGLPHQYQFSSLNNRKALVKGEKHKRRSSPLAIKIYKHKMNYIPAILLFKSIFLPNGEKLSIVEIDGSSNTVSGIPQPSYVVAQNFVNSFPGRFVEW